MDENILSTCTIYEHIFTFLVPVTNVTLIERQFSVNESEQMDLTCVSDYCNPQASITWYIGDGMIKTNTSTNVATGIYYLLQTTSTLHYKGVESDNGKDVYCKAYNSIGTTVESLEYQLDVKCKSLTMIFWKTLCLNTCISNKHFVYNEKNCHVDSPHVCTVKHNHF